MNPRSLIIIVAQIQPIRWREKLRKYFLEPQVQNLGHLFQVLLRITHPSFL